MVMKNIGNRGENNYQTLYTDIQVDRICQLMAVGMNYLQIQNLLVDLPYNPNFNEFCSRLRNHRCWNHITCKYNFEAALQRFPEEFIHIVCKMLVNKMSNKEISAALGVTLDSRLTSLCAHLRGHHPAYRRYWEMYDIPLVNAESREISLQDIDNILRMKANGATNKEIVKELGQDNPKVNTRSVYTLFKRLETKPNAKGRELAIKYGIIKE